MTLAQENSILSLIGTEPDGLMPIEVQKLMFVFSREEGGKPLYEFIPYEKGCYSPTLAQDVHKLASRRLLREIYPGTEKKRWALTEEGQVSVLSRRATAEHFARFRRNYRLRGKELLADVYRRYPYFAIKSKIADMVLRDDPAALATIERARPKTKMPLASIGYEGRTFEDYLNSLIRNGITVLCDVRKNPISRKYGFSKSVLQNACDKVGIDYRHFPELGIPSYERQDLRYQEDYDELFARYEKDVLPKEDDALSVIARLVENGDCVALTCFESNPAQCHRTRVLNYISKKTGVVAELI